LKDTKAPGAKLCPLKRRSNAGKKARKLYDIDPNIMGTSAEGIGATLKDMFKK
jgi:hypothetical protein